MADGLFYVLGLIGIYLVLSGTVPISVGVLFAVAASVYAYLNSPACSRGTVGVIFVVAGVICALAAFSWGSLQQAGIVP